jgi:hypothetical protein
MEPAGQGIQPTAVFDVMTSAVVPRPQYMPPGAVQGLRSAVPPAHQNPMGQRAPLATAEKGGQYMPATAVQGEQVGAAMTGQPDTGEQDVEVSAPKYPA